MHISLPPHVPHAPAHLTVLDKIMGIFGEEYKVMELFVMRFSPVSSYFLPLVLKYLPQHPTTKWFPKCVSVCLIAEKEIHGIARHPKQCRQKPSSYLTRLQNNEYENTCKIQNIKSCDRRYGPCLRNVLKLTMYITDISTSIYEVRTIYTAGNSDTSANEDNSFRNHIR